MPDDLTRRLQTLRETGPTCCDVEPATLRDRVEGDTFEQTLTRHQALADRRRLAVLAMLAEVDQLCACEIQAALDVTHATVSHHMGVLREADLVDAEKRGRWVYYALADDAGRWLP